MKFEIENDYKVDILGKEFNSVQYKLLLFGYILFLMIPWPVISHSYFFIPVGICVLPCILPDVIFNELFKSRKLYNILLYSALFLLTFIYTQFVIDSPFFVDVLHYVVYFLFGYIYSRDKNKRT